MIVWTEELSVGVKEIDDQHKELFVRVNSLVEAMSQGRGKSEIDGVLAFLEAYVVEHFGAEERLMVRKNYSHYAEHRAMHVAFAKTFSELKAELERSGARTVAIVQVHRQVVDWLSSHICKQDKAFGAFLQSQTHSKAA